jgi:hypothetical protein
VWRLNRWAVVLCVCRAPFVHLPFYFSLCSWTRRRVLNPCLISHEFTSAFAVPSLTRTHLARLLSFLFSLKTPLALLCASLLSFLTRCCTFRHSFHRLHVHSHSPQAKSSANVVRRNVFMTGPRAGVNFNDGSAGGEVLEQNLVFNFVRETGDHGMFNSWDRQPIVHDGGAAGSVALSPATHHLVKNFIMNRNWLGSTNSG